MGAQETAPQTSAQTGGPVIRAVSELVLVNVSARDNKGNPVRGLKPENFTILEDNKPQQIVSFDMEDVDAIAASASGPQPVTVLEAPPAQGTSPASAPSPSSGALKHRRLVVLFFDFTSMEPEEVDRAVTAAKKYVDQQMAPADLVAVASLSSELTVRLDFTADRERLHQALESLNPAGTQGLEAGATGDTEGTPDTGQAFTPDDTEFNIFNTDYRLEALRSLATMLAPIEQKKSVISFSSGMTRTGMENQSQLRAAINAAVQANLAIYTVDVRGLQAIVPGGEARQASLRGVSAYSGAAMRSAFDASFASQETLVTLAGDTGGRAFLDTNDFSGVFRSVQEDTTTYYVLGYHSNNPARDGKFRRITVRANQPGLKLEYRPGYYAPRDFQHSNKEDREQQLVEEMGSELPSTDLRVYLSWAYFRLRENQFFNRVSLVVPGSAIPFVRANDQERATLDILGVVLDEQKRPVGRIRDTVKLAVPESAQVRQKNVQYNTGFLLEPGAYHVKIVLRENQTGKLGSFQTDLVVPDFKAAPLKISSVVLSSQIQPSKEREGANPLAREGKELVPNVTRVFSQGQRLYLYYEVYDPAREPRNAAGGNAGDRGNGRDGEPGPRLLTNVQFFNGKIKVYETPLVQVRDLKAPDRHAALVQLEIPLAQLRPGYYTCQVNVIDDAAGRFAFPRLPLLIRK